MEAVDPLARVCALGAPAARAGVPVGFGAAALLHAAAFAGAALGVRVATARAHVDVSALDVAEVPVDVQPRAAADPEPALAIAPSRPPAQRAHTTSVPTSAPRPAEDAPARAVPILTSEAEGATPIVTGDSSELQSGLVRADGDGGGLGRGGAGRGGPRAGAGAERPAPPTTRGPDRSRPAALLNGYIERCDFPEGTERNEAVATVVVTVGIDARPVGADVLTDPGEGFGRQARSCLLRQLYRAALDRDGRLVAAKTTPIRVRFTR